MISLKFPLIGMIYAGMMSLYWVTLLITGFKEALNRKRFLPGIVVGLGIWITHMGLGWGFLKTIFR
jgi:uncharacterized membrane protein